MSEAEERGQGPPSRPANFLTVNFEIGWTRKFTEIKFNVPVDESKFNMPK